MAEETSECDLIALESQLQSLLGHYSSEELRGDSKAFCTDFCKLVEDFTSHWQVPLPQLRILQRALCYFAQASTSFPSNCDHVLDTLSSLALSAFELLLFFDQKDFCEESLQSITATFQESCLGLAKHQNVHLLQVGHLLKSGGPWANSILQAILSESNLPQNEVDEYISSELAVFFELRVRYLLSCKKEAEAMSLAKCCAHHPIAGQHPIFLQVYLTWLYKSSQHERLHTEVGDVNGKDAVHILCSLELEEDNNLLLGLGRAFLAQQLRRGDMYYLTDLVSIWSNLHSRLKTSKQALLEESRHLMSFTTNINSIFPFIRAILQELGEDGKQFCVELCANALGSHLPCDVITKSLIYKTIAGLLPNDLEICRLCALLVFFLERTVEAYKLVYILYMHPDQEYQVECSPIGNNVRCETLRILKKDLYFDPEFWNLIALRTSCLELLSEKVVSAALEEVMEDKWISNYCTKESSCQKAKTGDCKAATKKRQLKEDSCLKENTDSVSKRLRMGSYRKRVNVDNTVKRNRTPGSQSLKEVSSEPLRRSFWQLERIQDSVSLRYGELRRVTRLFAKNPPKRRIRTPRWLLEDSGSVVEKRSRKLTKQWLKLQKNHQSSVEQSPQSVQEKNTGNHKATTSFKDIQHNDQSGLSVDALEQHPMPQVILELSLPDNELYGTFNEDCCNREKGIPQVLLYKPTVKLPATSSPLKNAHGKEVILRARDESMLVQQLHCYARRQKGKGNGSIVHSSVSTITRSSAQASPPKNSRHRHEKSRMKRRTSLRRTTVGRQLFEKSVVEPVGFKKVLHRSRKRKLPSAKEVHEKSAVEEKASHNLPVLDTIQDQSVASGRDLCEVPALEMKVTIASETAASKMAQSSHLEKVCKVQCEEGLSEAPTTAKLGSDKISLNSQAASQSQDVFKNEEQKHKSLSSQADPDKISTANSYAASMGKKVTQSKISETDDIYLSSDRNNINNISSLTLVTEVVTKIEPEALGRDLENEKVLTHEKVVDVQLNQVKGQTCSEDSGEETEPETEESKLEYCCTFCHKDFKGRHVVAHAMFHYRKDECMFCGVIFRDDLLAMMHLSDHIEKLKKIKAQENCVLEKINTCPSNTSSKDVNSDKPLARRSRGRPRKSTVCPQQSFQDSTPSESRCLRSNINVVPVQKQNTSRQHTVHKANGHLRKKEVHRHLSELRETDGKRNDRKHHQPNSTASLEEINSPQNLKAASKQNEKDVEGKRAKPQETLYCPVNGCTWSTDLMKNRVALLYHALEDHHGEAKPLELAFRVGNSRCAICMRVLWSFEHFLHHVESHRTVPRYPCLHKGCTARFKTGMEMRRHARRHSPLQAVCCHPACSKLFICLWALNLHEREHYASKHARVKKSTPEQKDDKQSKATNGKKQEDHKMRDTAAPTAADNLSLKVKRKLRSRAINTSSRIKAKALSSIRKCVVKREMDNRKESYDSDFLRRAYSNQRRALRNKNPRKVISSSLRKHKRRSKMRTDLVKVSSALHRGRRRTPKAKHQQVVQDANTSTCQKPSTSEVPDICQNDLKLLTQATKTVQQDNNAMERPGDELPSKNTANKQIEENQKKDLLKNLAALVASKSLNRPIKMSTAEKTLRLNTSNPEKVKRSPSPHENAGEVEMSTSPDAISHTKATDSIFDSDRVGELPETALERPPEDTPALPQVEVLAVAEGPANMKVETEENTSQNLSSQSLSVVSVNCFYKMPPCVSDKKFKRLSKNKKFKKSKPKKKERSQEKNSNPLVSSRGKRKQNAIDKKRVRKNHCQRPDKRVQSERVEQKREGVTEEVSSSVVVPNNLSENEKGKHVVVHKEAVSSDCSIAADPNILADGKDSSPADEAKPKEETTDPESTKSKELKVSNPTKTKKKHMRTSSEGVKKNVRKKKRDHHQSDSEQHPRSESNVKVETAQKTLGGQHRGSRERKSKAESLKSSVCIEALAVYSKMPHLRPPPTVYLHESFISMPKRRKEGPLLQSPPSESLPPPGETSVPTAQQRQRCKNCFASFNSTEDLQHHLQLQKCTNLFGFDSDDEGNS